MRRGAVEPAARLLHQPSLEPLRRREHLIVARVQLPPSSATTRPARHPRCAAGPLRHRCDARPATRCRRSVQLVLGNRNVAVGHCLGLLSSPGLNSLNTMRLNSASFRVTHHVPSGASFHPPERRAFALERNLIVPARLEPGLSRCRSARPGCRRPRGRSPQHRRSSTERCSSTSVASARAMSRPSASVRWHQLLSSSGMNCGRRASDRRRFFVQVGQDRIEQLLIAAGNRRSGAHTPACPAPDRRRYRRHARAHAHSGGAPGSWLRH